MNALASVNPGETSGVSHHLRNAQEPNCGLPIRTVDKRNIVAAFVARATCFPDDIAIVDSSTSITYGRLLRETQSLAVRLREVHEAGTTAAIYGLRNTNTPLAMIACLLANITFVVIDAAYVKQRILDILTLSGAKTLLHEDMDDSLRGATATMGIRACPIRSAAEPTRTPDASALHETAYLLFTSGTTGFPKGIRTSHAPLIHFIDWYCQAFGPRPGSRFSMLSGLSHDPLLRDIFVPLSTGGQLFIPRQEDILAPDCLFDWIDASKVEFTHLTPQLVDVLHARRQRGRALDSLKFVFCGGDVLRAETTRQVANLAPSARLVNFYGTSETPQAMAYQMIEADMTVPYPLGSPIADVEIEIVDEALHPVPVGEKGEIAIVTDYLSDGYVTNATHACTSPGRQTYVSCPDASANATRQMYLTGDLGFKDELGRIFFNGRSDDQIKIRGYRVDCAEVASTIERHGLAQKVVALPECSGSGETALLAFAVGGSEHLQQDLRDVLPAHMMPTAVIAISAIPLLPNGKTDRAALYEIHRTAFERERALAARQSNPFFDAVADTLNVVGIDPRKSFVDMGGDSLSFIRVGLLIEDHLGSLPEGWEAMPFSALYDLTDSNTEAAASSGKLKLKHIEPAILLRAIAIVLVVLNHTHIGMNIIATSTLFVIAGMSFTRFLLPGLLDAKGHATTGRFILKYGLPAGLCELHHQLHQPSIWWPDIFMLGTMWANPAQHLTFWFLDILTVSILLVAVPAHFVGKVQQNKAGGGRSAQGFRFSMTVLMFAVIALFLQTQLDRWNGDIGVSSVGPFRWFWLFALGAAIQTARGRRQQMLLTGIMLALAVLCYGRIVTRGAFQEPFSMFLIVSVLALIWSKRVTVPSPLHGSLLLLAQHSLFIYIFSSWVPYVLMPKLVHVTGIQDWALLRIFLTFTVGIGASLIWKHSLHLVARACGRVKDVWTVALDTLHKLHVELYVKH